MNIDKLEIQIKEANDSKRHDFAENAAKSKDRFQSNLKEIDMQISEIDLRLQKMLAAESKFASMIQDLESKKAIIKAFGESLGTFRGLGASRTTDKIKEEQIRFREEAINLNEEFLKYRALFLAELLESNTQEKKTSRK